MPIREETNDEYHSSEPVSKSTLWKLHDRTPWHARFEKRKETKAFDFGSAAHIAILEPQDLEFRVLKGPAARGNSNEWKRAEDMARVANSILLKPDEYDRVLMIRDLAATIPEIVALQGAGKMVETSCYHVDQDTGAQVKCRPDIYSDDWQIIGDIKNMARADYGSFKRDVGKFGYHMQHAMYSDVWEKGSDLRVDGFVFIVFEKTDPPTVAAYELTPSAIAEGYAAYRSALEKYAECLKNGEWPGYPTGVQKIGLRRHDYKLTNPDPSELQAEEMEEDDEEDSSEGEENEFGDDQ